MLIEKQEQYTVTPFAIFTTYSESTITSKQKFEKTEGGMSSLCSRPVLPTLHLTQRFTVLS